MLHGLAHRVPLGIGDEQDPYEGASNQGCKSVGLHGAVLTVLLLQLLYHHHFSVFYKEELNMCAWD